jgi:hypothetical protein
MSGEPLALHQVRPSSLPKVKLCGHFQSDPVSGPAAERGTRLDTAFRALIQGVEPDVELSIEEGESLDWAVDSAKILAGGLLILSDEYCLKVNIPVIDMAGTSDLLCPEARWHGDLKSGEVRDYEAQMAAYALGWMNEHCVTEWTAYLFYCDQRYVQTYRFTLESAEEIVRDALALRLSDAPPRPNAYCGWCAARFDCIARREELGNHLPISRESPEWAKLDSVTLARFCGFGKVVEEWTEAARAELTRRIFDAKEEFPPGVSRGGRKGSDKLPGPAFANLPSEVLSRLLGDVGVEDAKAAFAEAGVEFPQDKVVTTPGASWITIRKPAELAAEKAKKLKVQPEKPLFD